MIILLHFNNCNIIYSILSQSAEAGKIKSDIIINILNTTGMPREPCATMPHISGWISVAMGYLHPCLNPHTHTYVNTGSSSITSLCWCYARMNISLRLTIAVCNVTETHKRNMSVRRARDIVLLNATFHKKLPEKPIVFGMLNWCLHHRRFHRFTG